MDNTDIATAIFAALESAGNVGIPTTVAANPDERDNQDWDLSILADGSGQQPTFIPRLQYLDIEMVRGLLLPERAGLQGQHGTMAEAGEHIDLALTNSDLTHKHITRMINWHSVDQLLVLNWGESARGTVRLVAAPIRDAKLAFFRTVYQALLTNPSGFLEEFGTIDRDSLKDSLGVPKLQEVTQTPAPPMTSEPLPGVDPSEPIAASVRALFASIAPVAEPIDVPVEGLGEGEPDEPELTSPVAPAPQPPEPDWVNPVAMSAEQTKRARAIVKEVLSGETPRANGLNWLMIEFGWTRSLANAYMGAAGRAPRKQPQPQPKVIADGSDGGGTSLEGGTPAGETPDPGHGDG
jgi:hypothetical protein